MKKKQIFTGEIEALDEEGQRKKQEEEEQKEQIHMQKHLALIWQSATSREKLPIK